MTGLGFNRRNQGILILDENQPVDDFVLSQQSDVSRRVFRPCAQGGDSLCESLKLAREALNLDIRTVASSLKIKPEQLESLEAGRVDAFPKFYALGFLRTYAAYLGEEALGFSANEAVTRFKEEREHFQKAQSLSFPAAVTEAQLPKAPVMVGSVFLAVLIYGAWLVLAGASLDLTDRVSGVPANLVAEVGAIELPAEDLSALLQGVKLTVSETVYDIELQTELSYNERVAVLVARAEEPAKVVSLVPESRTETEQPDSARKKVQVIEEAVGMDEEGKIHQNISVDIDQLLGLRIRTN